MLDLAGAVEAQWPDEGVAAHYGDPMREQRVMSERPTLVDRSNRGVIKITGPDRLSWLQSEQGQQRPLLGSADRHRHARLLGFELTEQPYPHEATIGPASAPRQCYLSPPVQAASQDQQAN